MGAMYYLFKMPAPNSSSSLYELIAESHSKALIEALYASFQNVGHYNTLLVTDLPTVAPKAKDKGTHYAKTRPDEAPKKY